MALFILRSCAIDITDILCLILESLIEAEMRYKIIERVKTLFL